MSMTKTTGNLLLAMALLLSLTGFAIPATARCSYSVTNIDNSAGLSSNTVKSVCQDRFGFMWIGTKNGLNRFDGLTWSHFQCYDSDLKRGNENIGALYVDESDRLWVGTDRGVYIYDIRSDRFHFLSLKTKEGVGPEDWVADITSDGNGNIWILIPNQGAFKLDCEGERMEFYSVTNHGGDKSRLPQHLVSVKGDIYVATTYQGLYLYDGQKNGFREVGTPETRATLRGRFIDAMCRVDDRHIALAGGPGDICIYDVLTGTLQTRNLSDTGKYVRALLSVGNLLFVGTQSGLFAIDRATGEEHDISREARGNDGISDNMIYSLYSDREGNVWVGTMFGGVSYLQLNGLIFERFSRGTSPRSLSGDLVRGLTATPDGHVWIGYEDGGFGNIDTNTGATGNGYPGLPTELSLTLKSKGNTVYSGLLRNGLYAMEPGKPARHLPIGDGNDEHSVYAVLEDSRGNLWCGLEWGLYVREAGNDTFRDIEEIGFDWISDILEASDGKIWIASMGNGVWVYDPRKQSYRHYAFEENYANGLRSNSVSAVMQDSRGNIWVSTDRGGLSRYVPDSDSFATYGVAEGLPDNVVYDVLEDAKGYLWFGTNNGLVKFDPRAGSVRTFIPRYNDMVKSFNYASAAVGADGRFYFGGKGGVVAFDPMCDSVPSVKPEIYITTMKIGNDVVTPGTDDAPISESLLYLDKIEFPYTRGVISFGVGFPAYSSHNAVTYSYRLLPGDEEWITVTDPANISFVNLVAGDYTLEVKADCGDLTATRSYEMSVLPPWYQTWWAWLIYISIFGGIGYTWWRWYRERQQKELKEQAIMVNISREKELYKNKVQFFTEIAHEIRTPLSLIGSPLEAIDEIGVKDERIERYLKTIRLNTKRLLDLTTNLLDFQQIDREEHSLRFTNVDVNQLVQDIFTRFELTMSLKNKSLTVHLPQKPVMATIDAEAITKIVSNLFNNAMKYSNGKIDISLTADDKRFRLEVASDGTPIEGEDRMKIFEPFYQIERSGHAGGVGIGLPMSATLAKLHGGSLRLADESIMANTFVLEAPLAQEGIMVEVDSNPVKSDYVLEDENGLNRSVAGYSMLLVEDNDEMRAFLNDQLDKSFAVETASNGQEALDLMAEHKFDIIVTDIMMPVMDGYELCRRIKDNPDTSNIPVVFLTAKNDLESKLKALKCGGESYIEKPFSLKFFRQQIMSLLDNRQNERQAFMKKPFFGVSNMKLNKADEEFMNKVIAIINENIADENFSVETVADTFCMSRSSLLRPHQDYLQSLACGADTPDTPQKGRRADPGGEIPHRRCLLHGGHQLVELLQQAVLPAVWRHAEGLREAVPGREQLAAGRHRQARREVAAPIHPP